MDRILVIDDDPQIREMLKQLLEMNGYEVILAPEGRTGLKLHHQTPADLIVTDIVMPEKEGLETIMDFRRGFPGIKIIAISGGGVVEADKYLNTAKALGAQRTFSKPFELNEFMQAVRDLLPIS